MAFRDRSSTVPMARLPRLYAPGTVQYVLQRPASGRSLFLDADDYALASRILEDATRAHGVAVHAYALLPQELRLLATPADAESIARAMQAIGRRYVPHLNRKAGRSGALWDRRYRSTLVDPAAWLIAAMRHIEHRPVALGHALDPAQWRWSSHAHHAGLGQEAWIQDHAAYWALSNTPFERQAAYRDLSATPLDTARAARIEAAVENGWVLGDDAYATGLQPLVNRRLRPLPRGRRSRSDRPVPQ